jgi:adenylate kinase family enzyme
MAVKVFILGRPGSGKSTAARRIANLVQPKGWSPIRISDYDILRDMFQKERNSLDNEPKNFIPTQYGGFDVIDFSVLDTALKEVHRKALKYKEEYTSCTQKFVLIEFARDDYKKALSFFSPDFLRDAYFLFLDADIDTCIQRVHERTAHPITVDDHFVSDKIIKCYYDKDNKPYMTSNLAVDYYIDEKQVVILDNINSRQHFNDEVNQFVNIILRQASQAQQKTDSLQNALTLSLVHAVPNTSGMSKVEVGQQ